jgi:uncharacterized membrane protein YeaQ/YmgE (transglycosylase-associated protein family)
MSNALVHMILTLISGGVGGNLAAAILKRFSLGPLGNTIVGLIGGGLGGQLVSAMAGAEPAGILGSIAGSTVGGGVLMAIVGLIKSLMATRAHISDR